MDIQFESTGASPTPYSHKPKECGLKTVARVALGVFSVGAGFTIAFPGTVPEWDKPLIFATNIGVVGAFGAIGSWGLYMSGEKIFGEFFVKCGKKSLFTMIRKAIQVAASLGLGFFAQIPIGVIAYKFHGLAWAIATQIGGFWTQGYSQYALIDVGISRLKQIPYLYLGNEKKCRIIIACRIQKIVYNLSRHARIQSSTEREYCYRNWMANRLIENQNMRVQKLFEDIVFLSEELFQPPKIYSRGEHLLKNGLQLTATVGGLLIFYQTFLLSQDFWNKEVELEIWAILLSLLSVIPYLYSTFRGTINSSGDLFDLVACFWGGGEANTVNVGFPKLSRGLYLLALAIAVLPQMQTIKISEQYYSINTPFGMTFMISNVLAMTLYIYMAMKDLIDVFLEQGIDMRLAADDIKKIRELQNDLQRSIQTLEEKSITELCGIVSQIPHQSVRQSIFRGIDRKKLCELVHLQEEETWIV